MYPFRWMTQDQMILKSMCHKEVYLPVDHRRKPQFWVHKVSSVMMERINVNHTWVIDDAGRPVWG